MFSIVTHSIGRASQQQVQQAALPDHTGTDARARSVFFPLALAGIIVCLFSGVLGCNFVAWDDGPMVYANPFLHPISSAGLGYLWTHSYYGLYAPLTYTFYAALADLSRALHLNPSAMGMGDLSPVPFHAAGLLLHMACVVTVYQILRRLTVSDIGAFIGALVFGLHPVQVEPVAWVGSIDTVLSALFSLLSVWQYLCRVQAEPTANKAILRTHYALATLFFVLALLSKPSAVAVPLIAAVIAVGFARRSVGQTAREIAPWLIIAAIWIHLTQAAQPFDQSAAGPIWTRPLIAGDALAFYLGKLAWPAVTSADYGRSPHAVLGHAWIYITWLAPAAGLALAWSARKSWPWLPVCAVLWLAALIPVLGLVPFAYQQYSTVADRYLYLAMLAPACAAAFLLRAPKGTVALTAVGAAAIALALVSLRTIPAWQDSLRLFSHGVDITPSSAVLHYNLGETYERKGLLAGAISQYNTAVALDPDYAEAHCNLAGALAQVDRPEQSVEQYRLALVANPRLSQAHDGIALDYAQAGRLSDAIAQWQAALQYDPSDTMARRNLAIAIGATDAPAHRRTM